VTVPPALLSIGRELFWYGTSCSGHCVNCVKKLARSWSNLIFADKLGGEFLSTP